MDVKGTSPYGTHLRNRYLLASDVVLFTVSVVIAFALRFDGWDWGPEHSKSAVVYLLLSLPVKVLVLWWAGLYRRLWRYAGMLELERLLVASAVSGFAGLLIGGILLPVTGLTTLAVPLSVLFLDGLLTGILATLPRLAVRAFGHRGHGTRRDDARRALIVGAGAAGELIVKELLGAPAARAQPVGFVDDDPQARHRMCNLPVLGRCRQIPELFPGTRSTR